MDTDALLEEMVKIVLNKGKSQETDLFFEMGLDHSTVRWGCMRILDWLRAQAVSLRQRPLELNPASVVDASCISIIKANSFLREVMEIKDNCLVFSQNVSQEKARQMMLWARENYRPRIRT